MLRHSMPLWVAVLLVLLATACGEKPEIVEKPDAREAQIRKVRQQAAEMQVQAARIQERIEEISTQVGEGRRQIESQLAKIDQLQEELVSLALSAERLDILRKEMDRSGSVVEPEDKEGGWPWFIYLILVAAIVVIVLIFKHLSRDDDLDEEPLVDEGFVEENDLGTIRYPGKRGDSDTKPSE